MFLFILNGGEIFASSHQGEVCRAKTTKANTKGLISGKIALKDGRQGGDVIFPAKIKINPNVILDGRQCGDVVEESGIPFAPNLLGW